MRLELIENIEHIEKCCLICETLFELINSPRNLKENMSHFIVKTLFLYNVHYINMFKILTLYMLIFSERT